MSNRIRVLLRHPDIVPTMGGAAFRIIEQKFAALQARRQHAWIQPFQFVGWPRWKRCGWMAKKLGERWVYKVFREKRGAKASQSVFWRACIQAGLNPPRRRRKPQPIKVAVKKQVAAVLANGNRIYYAGGARPHPAANDWIIDGVGVQEAVAPDEVPAPGVPRPGRLRPRNDNPFGNPGER